MDKSGKGSSHSFLIGANGTGKSAFLRSVADIFRDLEAAKKANKKHRRQLPYQYAINYSLAGTLFEVDFLTADSGVYTAQGVECTLGELQLPSRILAVTSVLNDKFVFDDRSAYYRYLGPRTASNLAGSRAGVKKIIKMLLTEGDSQDVEPLSEILSLFGFQPEIRLTYDTHRKLASLDELEWQEWLDRQITADYSFFHGDDTLNGISLTDILYH